MGLHFVVCAAYGLQQKDVAEIMGLNGLAHFETVSMMKRIRTGILTRGRNLY